MLHFPASLNELEKNNGQTIQSKCAQQECCCNSSQKYFKKVLTQGPQYQSILCWGFFGKKYFKPYAFFFLTIFWYFVLVHIIKIPIKHFQVCSCNMLECDTVQRRRIQSGKPVDALGPYARQGPLECQTKLTQSATAAVLCGACTC